MTRHAHPAQPATTSTARCRPMLALVLLAAVSVGACAGFAPVQAWEKGTLARPEMTFEDDRLDAAFQEHTYNSKEGAAGGAGVGGGGCGCN